MENPIKRYRNGERAPAPTIQSLRVQRHLLLIKPGLTKRKFNDYELI